MPVAAPATPVTAAIAGSGQRPRSRAATRSGGSDVAGILGLGGKYTAGTTTAPDHKSGSSTVPLRLGYVEAMLIAVKDRTACDHPS